MKKRIYGFLVQLANSWAVYLGAEKTSLDTLAAWFDDEWEDKDPRLSNVR